MKSLSISTLIFLLLSATTGAFGQKSMQDSSIVLPTIGLGYTGAGTGGDLASRYGFFSAMTVEGTLKLRSNFYIRGGVHPLFGTQIKELIAPGALTYFETGNGEIRPFGISSDGSLAEVRFFMRGYTIPLTIGKIFSIIPTHNPNSGIYLEAGAQFMQHKVRIEQVSGSIPQLSNEYLPGYDRLTNGIGAVQAIGYRFHGNRKLVNFELGLRFTQNFTESRRDFNFDYGFEDNRERLDITYGFYFGWLFPIYRDADKDVYF